ncbi:T9SS type A sorting domain-containing protein [Hymenobacter psychrotolerans]|uniref:Por secretion system C-terminal sorting domain-containing protein n=1 Tax=Hymenobacter psychrotolerans DSM 18569 TaxID=1121959 RepID=A0A1M7FSE0_9BACT|nr:T9SS type A sorting domain-containing protein [Hymenobacter psychrotolerans]SHM06587.1 Por secretion system C-terminal sorting domain-containing protein [Hymenobacter psychrotolerans DSM 18569]
MRTDFYSPVSWLTSGARTRLTALAAALLLAPAAWAQAPANDNCSGAIALTAGTTCTVTAATNLNATASTGVAAPGANCFVAATPVSNDVWYSIVVPASGGITVTTSAVTGSLVEDTGMTLYTGTCGGTLTEVGCSDDASGSTLFSSATATGLTAGATVYARVWSFGTTPTGAFGICATAATAVTAPANDDCAGAVTLTPGATCTPTNGTVAGATQSQAPILCNGFTATTARDVWYTFTATATTHTINVTGTFDGVLEVLGGSCGALTNVGCSDATGNAETLTLTTLTVGTTYKVRYYPYSATVASSTFSICIAPPPSAPANDNPSGAVALTIGATCTPVNGTNAAATTTTPNGYANPGAAPYTCGIAASPKDVWYTFTTAASGAGSTAVTIQVTGAPAGYIRIFSAASAAGPFTERGCAAGTTNNTVSAPLTLNTLTPSTTYYVSVAGYGSADTQGAFTICAVAATPLAANDAAAQIIYSVGKAPVSAPQVVQAVVRNAGSAALTNLPVTLNVTGATTFTDIKLVPTLAPGATATVTFAAYTPATVGTNTLTVSVPADGGNTNNSQTYTQAVTANSLSYIDDAQPLNATGVGVSSTTPGGTLAARYSINSASTIGDVKVTFTASPTTTSTYQVVILNATATGTPGTVIFTSPTQTRPTAAGVVTVPVTGTVAVNGTFYVGLKEISGNVGVAYQVEDPLRPATFYYQTSATGAWTDVNTTTLKTRLGIEVGFSTRVLSTNSAALSKAINMFPNPSTGQVTLDIQGAQAKAGMQVEVTNMLGQVVHTAAVRDNAKNQLDLSNLSNGLYVLRVKSGSEYTVRQLVLTK